MKKPWLLLILILVLAACTSYPSVPVSIEARIELPEDPSKPESGQFLPEDTPFKVHFTLNKTGTLPPDSHLAVRALDQNDVEYLLNSWLLPEISDGKKELTRLVRITGLPGSKKIRLQTTLLGPDNKVYSTNTSGKDGWTTIITGYALCRSVNYSRGWYSPEPSKDVPKNAPDGTQSKIQRWCKGTGIVHFQSPLFPVFLNVRGLSLPECFPENQWTFTAGLNGQELIHEILTQETFHYRMYIGDVRSTEQSGTSTWPSGELELSLAGDQIFVPYDCNNQPDKRKLAFYINHLALSDVIFEAGFYSTELEDNCYWPAPDFTVRLPHPTDQTELFIQGQRKIDCIELPQTITITVDGVALEQKLISDESFCLSWPVEPTDSLSEHVVRVTVSPVFFRAQCMDTDDSRPYGFGLQEICIR